MTKQCKACGKAFQSHPKVPNQTYCSSPECQCERRRRWLEEKRQFDADYQGNEPQKIEQWRNEHPDYWKQYRLDNPDYAQPQPKSTADPQSAVQKSDDCKCIRVAGAFPFGLRALSAHSGDCRRDCK